MQVQRYDNYRSNTSFGTLYMNLGKIEKVLGKNMAQEAKNAIPELKELAKDVNIEVRSATGYKYTGDLGLRGFDICISKIMPEMPEQPKKSYTKNEIQHINSRVFFKHTPSNKTVAEELVENVKETKRMFSQFVKYD